MRKILDTTGHVAHASQETMLGEGGVVIESDRLAQSWIDPAEHREHDGDGLGGGLAGEARRKGQARFPLVQDEYGPGALADDEIALPVTGFGPGFDPLRSIVDGGAIPDRVARGSCAAGPAAAVAAREIAPQLLGFLGRTVDEGIDGFTCRSLYLI